MAIDFQSIKDALRSDATREARFKLADDIAGAIYEVLESKEAFDFVDFIRARSISRSMEISFRESLLKAATTAHLETHQ